MPSATLQMTWGRDGYKRGSGEIVGYEASRPRYRWLLRLDGNGDGDRGEEWGALSDGGAIWYTHGFKRTVLHKARGANPSDGAFVEPGALSRSPAWSGIQCCTATQVPARRREHERGG